MTAVAIWNDGGRLWAAADTRISVDRTNGRTIKTDAASKLLALPVLCMPLRQMFGVEYTPHSQRTYGIAFAGDVVPALMTYATAVACFSDLQAHDPAEPALRDIANFVRRTGTSFGREAAHAINRQKLPFEMAVFGWCPRLHGLAIYSLRPSTDDPLILSIEETRPHPAGPLVTLGSRGPQLAEGVDSLRHGNTNVALGHLPRVALDQLIAGAGFTDDVGGSVSYGIADARGFQLAMKVHPTEGTMENAHVTFNNINVDGELGNVGHYKIGMTAVR